MTKRNSKFIKGYQLFLLALPALLYYIVFHYWPIYGLQIAFKQFNPRLGIMGSPWAGLVHFQRFVTGPSFTNLIGNTLSISLSSLIFGFPAPILLALTLNELRRSGFRRLVQTVSYAPYFISTVVMVSMLMILLNRNVGIVNQMLGSLGVESIDFMARRDWFVPTYVMSGIWQTTGWGSIVYLAALSGISPELHEAAMVDGASRIQRIWHINLPGIRPTITIMFILASGGIMTVGFEKAFLMQSPLTLQVSEVISTYVYKVGLLQVQYSFASAVGLFNSFINFALLMSVNYLSRRFGDTRLV